MPFFDKIRKAGEQGGAGAAAEAVSAEDLRLDALAEQDAAADPSEAPGNPPAEPADIIQVPAAQSTAVLRQVVSRVVFDSPAYDNVEGGKKIEELDRLSLLERYGLPPLVRMSAQDQAGLVEPLLSLKRIRRLGVDPDSFAFPEARYKRLYNQVLSAVDYAKERAEEDFYGDTISELNAFLHKHAGKLVQVRSSQLVLDESLSIPSGTAVEGNGVDVVRGETEVEKAVLLDGVDDVVLSGFYLSYVRYPIFVKNCTNFAIVDNSIYRVSFKGITVMGRNSNFVIARNRLDHTDNGGMFFDGDISNGIIEDNTLQTVGGSGNFSGGMVFTALEIDDMDTAFNPWKQLNLTDLVEAPHDIVVLHNRIEGAEANGIYSHGGYCIYLVANHIENNNKEGMCLDFGSCGYYVAYNLFKRNGGRYNMTQELLEEDFIQDHGLLPDGSSPAKVPGISLDNAAYNILYQNIVAENSGSGIKMVRSGLRNVVLCNEVTDNNLGENDQFHFFGIELGSDFKPDYHADAVQELDFTPCFENIIARNTVSGSHFSGIFLGRDAYINDVFDNTIIGAARPLEITSEKHNPIVNNFSIAYA